MIFNVHLETEEKASALLSMLKDEREIANAEDAVVAKVGYYLYRKLFAGYTRKQWGIDPKQLSPEITLRIPVRTNTDDRYFTDAYQYMPKEGYTKMVDKMLSNKNIGVILGIDYKDMIKYIRYKYMIYTGAIDYFFDYKYGRLRYRSLRFEHETYNMESYQPAMQINYPSEELTFTRIIEPKKATGQKHGKTTIIKEFPSAKGEPYYPMLTEQDKMLYAKYKADAEKLQDTYFVGRLAEFRYYNMDQAVASALQLSERIVKRRR